MMKSLPVCCCVLSRCSSVPRPLGHKAGKRAHQSGDSASDADLAARPMAEELSRLLKVPIVVINRRRRQR
jgi:hypothetical protein